MSVSFDSCIRERLTTGFDPAGPLLQGRSAETGGGMRVCLRKLAVDSGPRIAI